MLIGEIHQNFGEYQKVNRYLASFSPSPTPPVLFYSESMLLKLYFPTPNTARKLDYPSQNFHP